MKITFILPTLNFSGGVMGVMRYCDELNKLGHICNIYYPFTQYRGIHRPKTHGYFFSAQIPDADIVIATSWETVRFVNKLPKEKGKKVYYIQHWEQWKYHNTGIGTDINSEVEQTYYLPLKHLFVSRFISRQIGENNPLVVHAGTDIPESFKKDYSGIKILYPLRAEPWKGQSTLEPALKQILNEFPNAVIKSFGIPFVSQKEKIELLKWANIFVFPSWIEGFGSPPLEAVSYGCAVVSTTTNAMPELFTDEMLWVEPKSTTQIYNAIKYLIQCPSEIVRLGTAAQQQARNYTWEKAAKNFEEVLCGI